ncbi:gamma-glutamylcyclotransferase [Rheinheimera salexigens]|uniref:glutathione-specific gamma-glutamylcyclotransferase n=1 Tax=Rheinheimera salexigens TaxID=1628148 RepID=A0A1E7QAA5_9GAMM|nr:gamma-glutamylcyclotransferase [Rheinheimera salexigens]
MTDTRQQNANRQLPNVSADSDDIWLFGYGSLIYKVDFPFLEQRPAKIFNWQRRFWQGSHDHRGTPESPGRVATLIEAPGASCEGMAFRVEASVFEQLDYREKNGYLRFKTDLHFADNEVNTGITYIATTDNTAYLGPASEKDIASHIARSAGESGDNSDYLLQLAQALRQLEVDDPHVFEIEYWLTHAANSNLPDTTQNIAHKTR